MIKLDARELRDLDTTLEVERQEIYVILDSVYDLYNVGSAFRVADAIGAKEVLVCGLSQFKYGDLKVKRASINTTEIMNYDNFPDAKSAIKELRKEVPDIQIIAIEQSQKAVNFRRMNYRLPLGLVVGSETKGISKTTLALCDKIVEIPMFGVNRSMNVIHALALVAYQAICP